MKNKLISRDVSHLVAKTTLTDKKEFIALRVDFKNGRAISILYGDKAYSDKNTFEVATFNSNGKMDTRAITIQMGLDDPLDDVLGWQTKDEVISYVHYLATLPD